MRSYSSFMRFAAVLAAVLLASMLAACNDKGGTGETSVMQESSILSEPSNSEPMTPDTDNEKGGMAEESADKDTVREESVDELPEKQTGSLGMNITGGAVWGYYGLGNTGEKTPIGDLIESSLGDMAREQGWTVHIELYKAPEGEAPSVQSAQERAEAFVPNIVAADGGPVECLVYVLYDADLNDAYIYIAGEDMPDIDTAYIESVFEDESVTDPYDRAVNGINALADALERGV